MKSTFQPPRIAFAVLDCDPDRPSSELIIAGVDPKAAEDTRRWVGNLESSVNLDVANTGSVLVSKCAPSGAQAPYRLIHIGKRADACGLDWSNTDSDAAACALAKARGTPSPTDGPIVVISAAVSLEVGHEVFLPATLRSVLSCGTEGERRWSILSKWNAATSHSDVCAMLLVRSDAQFLIESIETEQMPTPKWMTLEDFTNSILARCDGLPMLVALEADQLREVARYLGARPELFRAHPHNGAPRPPIWLELQSDRRWVEYLKELEISQEHLRSHPSYRKLACYWDNWPDSFSRERIEFGQGEPGWSQRLEEKLLSVTHTQRSLVDSPPPDVTKDWLAYRQFWMDWDQMGTFSIRRCLEWEKARLQWKSKNEQQWADNYSKIAAASMLAIMFLFPGSPCVSSGAQANGLFVGLFTLLWCVFGIKGHLLHVKSLEIARVVPELEAHFSSAERWSRQAELAEARADTATRSGAAPGSS